MISRNNHETPPSVLPSEFLLEITEVLNTQYENRLKVDKKESLHANALVFQTEVILVISLTKPEELRSFNIYASIDYLDEKTSLNEAIYHLVDSTGFFLEEYFASDRKAMLPENWTRYEINNKIVYLRGDTRNLSLEKIADNIIDTHNSTGSTTS